MFTQIRPFSSSRFGRGLLTPATGFTPKKPWRADCQLVISEIRTKLFTKGTNGQEFIELERVCAPKVARNVVDLFEHFKLIQVRAKTNSIVRFCSLAGKMDYIGKNPKNPLLLIGNENTPRVNIGPTSSRCISVGETDMSSNDPSESFGILLVYNKGNSFF